VHSKDDFIKLCDFLKCCGAVESGGHAKALIQAGDVLVNGEVETRRGKKLRSGDRVTFDGMDMVVGPDNFFHKDV